MKLADNLVHFIECYCLYFYWHETVIDYTTSLFIVLNSILSDIFYFRQKYKIQSI